MRQETKDLVLMLLLIAMFAVMLGALLGAMAVTAENRTMRTKLEAIKYVVENHEGSPASWTIIDIITDGGEK